MDPQQLTPASAALDAARQRIILALDVESIDAARVLLERTRGHVGAIKVGKELFTSAGPASLQLCREFNLPIFLDLKFHDIPNTVAGAVRAAAGHGVRWTSVHTAGGAAMLEAAVRARNENLASGSTQLLGITVLTSLPTPDPEEVVERALLAKRCGLDGVVASPQDVRRLRDVCGDRFTVVTPGVRPAGVECGDQVRVATPAQAVRDGADYLVIGRPIHAAADPAAAATAIAAAIAHEAGDTLGDTHDRGRESGKSSRDQPAPGSVDARLTRLLRESEAFLEGHFILTSGLHSNRYVQCAKLLQHPQAARRAGIWLAERLQSASPEVVMSVALGGVVIGQEVAAALNVPALFAERDASGGLKLRRGFGLRPGARVAIVDDVCTRGGSIAECAALVQELGGRVAITGAIIDRSGGDREFDLPFVALKVIDAKAIPPEACELCAAGVPVEKPGSRPSN